jgi:hypothetical protein
MNRTLRPVFVALCAGLLTLCSEAEAKDATLMGYDVICRSGRTAKLKAKLESKGFMGINPDVDKEPIDFFVVGINGKELADPKFVGTQKTNDDGVATLKWKPDAPGQYELEARVRRGREYVATPAPIWVAIPDPKRTIILVQIDNTVSTATNLKLFRGTDNKEIMAVAGAQQTLNTLAQHYQLVYLTDLERAFTDKFKSWLTLRNMPPAPVLFWDLFERSLSHGTYMKKLVAKLHKDLGNAAVGIGADDDDGAAFVASNLAAIVITDDPEDLQSTVVGASRWADVIQHVVRLHDASAKIHAAAGADVAKRDAALADLSLLGKAGVGYLHRFRQSTDPNLASAATLVCGKLLAFDAFRSGLSTKTPNDALHSLLAAWKYGELGVVVRLYRDPDSGKNDPMPTFTTCKLVSRHEPEPGKVVYKISLSGQGDPSEHTLVFVKNEESETWHLDVEEF